VNARFARHVPVLIAFLFLALNLIGLDRSPVVWMDEVTLNDPARTWVSTGTLRSSVYSDSTGFDRGYFWQPPGQVLVMAAVYSVAGFGVWQTRVPGLLFASLAIIVIASIARGVFGSELAAASAALLLALDPQFIQTARSGRMDAQCILLALLALLVYFRAVRKAEAGPQHRLLFAAGLLTGLAGITHPVAAAWAPAIALCIILFDRDRIRGALVFGSASAVPLVLWLAYAKLSNQWEFFTWQFLAHGSGHSASGAVWTRFADEWLRISSRYRLAPLLLVVYATALATIAVRSRTDSTRRVVVLFVSTFLFVALFMGKADAGFYFLHPVAMAVIAFGGFVSLLWHGHSSHWRTAGIALVVLACANAAAAGFGARWAALAYQWSARDYDPVARSVTSVIPSGSVVWGREEAWYALENVGAELRVSGRPNPLKHDFAIIRPESTSVLPPGARLVAGVDASLPPLFGRIALPSQDYRLQVWKLH
jgi:4-amino-4-deoxy-L-arabinose transferase-like glycosyltransferase